MHSRNTTAISGGIQASSSPLFPPPADPLTGWLDSFDCASLELLKQRELLERVDRKFLAPVHLIPALLSEISDDYRVLPAGAKLWADYETCYFDTNDLSCFHEHIRGRRPRFKVRVRHYPERAKSFLEVKMKGNNGKTVKARSIRAFGDSDLGSADWEFIARNAPLQAEQLLPSVWTNFRRATLLGVSTNERLTIDLDLTFIRGEAVSRLQRLAIVELKQSRASHSTPAFRALRDLRIRESSLSKYCAAVATLHEEARPRARHTMQIAMNRAFQ